MVRSVVFPGGSGDIYEQYGFSAAVQSGGFLFVSGQVGALEDGTPVDDPAGQIAQAFYNLEKVLDAVGCKLDDVVDVTSFHVDMHTHFDAFASVKRRFFPEKPFPNWTAIGVVTLADPALIFEIKVTARIPENHARDTSQNMVS